MKTLEKLNSGFLATLFVLAVAVAAMADPPSRVARLQYISGAISVQPSGVNDWVEGAINRPLTTSDRVWADKDSRAELHLGNAYMRIDSETSITLTNVADNAVQVELDQGTLNLRIRHLYDGEIYEVDTPNMAFTLTKAGDYRFDVDPNRDISRVTVRKGEGEATGDDRAVKVRKGESADFSAGTSLQHQIAEAAEPDGFDDWCHVRNERLDHSESARYVSPDVIGAEDLDQYGAWHTVPTYGAIWVPAVAPGWAPYHYGHWVWVEPWGWTWIDDAPWGFAPCHYGRWVYYRNYWGWVPGPVAVRPVYAPALVAWVGGSHWGVGLSFGSGGGVGWFPLGYGEPYVPAYHASRNYFQSVNVSNTHITNITNVTNNYYNTNVTNNNTTKIVYKNQSVPGAMTAVSKTVITSSQPVARAAVPVPLSQVRAATVASAPEVAPAKASVLGTRGSQSLVPPAQANRRQVVSKLAPPPKPVPFNAKQEALAAHPGRPLDSTTEQQIRARVGGQPNNTRNQGAMATTSESPAAQPPTKIVTKPENPGASSNVSGTSGASVTARPSGPRIVPSGPQKQAVTSESPVGNPAAAVPVAPRQVFMPGAARPTSTEPANAKSAPMTPPAARQATTAEAPAASPARAVPQPPSAQSPKQNVTEPGQNFPSRIVPRPPVNSRVVNSSTPVFPNRVEQTPAVAHPANSGSATPAPTPAVANSPAVNSPSPARNAENPRSMTSNVPRPPANMDSARRPASDPSTQPASRPAQPATSPVTESHASQGVFSAPRQASQPVTGTLPSQPAARPVPPATAQRSIDNSPRMSAPAPRNNAPSPRVVSPEPRRESQVQRSAPVSQNAQRQSPPPAQRPAEARPASHNPVQEHGTRQRDERNR